MKANKPILAIALLLGSLLPLSAQALPSDRDKPIRIQANKANLDDRQGIAIYTGNVILTQGTIELRGDRITIYRDNAGTIKKLVAVGKPARYQEKTDPAKGVLHAYGLTIEYLAQQEKVHLIKQAKVNQDGNVFTGDRIDYDLKTDLVNARATDNNDSGRVEMLIQPRSK